MDSYEVIMTRSAEKELSSLPKSLVGVLWKRIRALADQPRQRQTRKLKDAEKSYRLRVGRYRIVYTIDDGQKLVRVTAIRHRREAYR